MCFMCQGVLLRAPLCLQVPVRRADEDASRRVG